MKYLVEEKEEDVDDAAVVRAPRIKKEAVETRIRTEEARRVPGTQGDTLKVVQNLPGVARSSFGSGELIVWGSAPNETRVNVDGVEIPTLYHVGGLRSTINSDLVRSIDLSPGSYGAEYGRGLGGLVRIDLGAAPQGGRRTATSPPTSSTPRRCSSTALTPRLRLAVAGRFSYLDQLLPLVTSQDVGDFVPIPRYDDYQARATLALRQDEELAADVPRPPTITCAAPSPRTIPTEVALAEHRQRLEAAHPPLHAPAPRRRQRRRDALVRLRQRQQRGAVRRARRSTSGQSTWQYAPARQPTGARSPPSTTLSFGIDMQAQSSTLDRNGSLTLPAREGDIFVFGQPPAQRHRLRPLERPGHRHRALTPTPRSPSGA